MSGVAAGPLRKATEVHGCNMGLIEITPLPDNTLFRTRLFLKKDYSRSQYPQNLKEKSTKNKAGNLIITF